MKITKRQKEEIDFLQRRFSRISFTGADVTEYINATVYGKGEGDKFSTNPICIAKQRKDLQVALWREDLTRGIISFSELEEDFTCPYGARLIEGIRKSITPAFRRATLSTGIATTLAVNNFPEIAVLFAR